MRLLLDTHALFWATITPAALSPAALNAIADADNAVYVSVATAWEIGIKVGSGKWPEAADMLRDFDSVLADAGFQVLPVTIAHVRAAGLLASPHRDPFDRVLAAQALLDDLTVMTADRRIQDLGARTLW